MALSGQWSLIQNSLTHPQKKLAATIGASILLVGILVVFVILARQEKLSYASPLIAGPIRYNCELSGGTFQNDRCTCRIEGFQTQELMYDKDTGFCQSTVGAPAGDAFNASIGLPYGEYDYWTQIVVDLCTNSGGNISGAACICPSGKNYSKTNGRCE
jgi:hypothetical protein